MKMEEAGPTTRGSSVTSLPDSESTGQRMPAALSKDTCWRHITYPVTRGSLRSGDMDKKLRLVRWLLDFLFCLYGSLLYVANRYSSSDLLLDKIFHWIRITDKVFVARFHVSPFGASGSDPQLFNSEWLVVSLLTFACVRLLGQIGIVERFIPFVGVCFTVARPQFSSLAASPEWYMAPRVWLMRLEVAVVIFILLRYAHRTSRASTSLCLGTLLAHFWLWGWIMVTYKADEYTESRHTLFTLTAFVLLPLCTSLLWVVYSRMRTSSVVADRATVNSR